MPARPYKFLITVWPVPGHIFPQIAIAHALRRRGHECAFYTGKRMANILADEGFRHYPFQSVDEEQVFDTLFSPGRGSTQPKGKKDFAELLRKWMLDTVPQQVEDIERVLEDWRPDVLSTDPSMMAPILILRERNGIPVAISSFVPGCMIPGPDAPPFGLGLPRPRNFHTRLLSRLVAMGTKFAAAGFRRAASDLRQRYGLAPLTTSVLAYTGTVSLYLVPSTPEFDYERRDLPPCVRYVGPYLWNKPKQIEPPDWLTDLRRDRPWVHVSEGTVHVQDPFVLRSAAQGLAGLNMEVIMTTGGNREIEELNLGPMAPNIHIARWISHNDLLPKTDLMVTTAGAGSTLAALAAGVPLICIPTEWDKPEISQRVVEAGAGLRLAPRRCTPKTLRAAVERVLGDSSFRQNARRLAKVFSEHGGADRAAELLEGLAKDI